MAYAGAGLRRRSSIKLRIFPNSSVGGEVGQKALRSLAFGGRYVIVGWASNVPDSDGRAAFAPDRLPTNIMQMKCLQVMGSPMAIY